MGAEPGDNFHFLLRQQKWLITWRAPVELRSQMLPILLQPIWGDKEVYEQPEKYFDEVIEINLDELEPHINGPFTQDLAWLLE